MRLFFVVLLALAFGCEDQEDFELKVAKQCIERALASPNDSDLAKKWTRERCCDVARASKKWAAKSIVKKCDEWERRQPAKP